MPSPTWYIIQPTESTTSCSTIRCFPVVSTGAPKDAVTTESGVLAPLKACLVDGVTCTPGSIAAHPVRARSLLAAAKLGKKCLGRQRSSKQL